MPMTLQDAVVYARNDKLDDNGTRWTDEQAVRALKYALSDVAHEYVDAGGDVLRRMSAEVSSSSGIIDISSLDPIQIHGLVVKIGNSRFPVHATKQSEMVAPDEEVRTFQVDYSERPEIGTASFDGDGAFSSGSGNPLVTSDGTTQISTWDTFEELVCLRAALRMVTKDGDRSLSSRLREEERAILANVMKRDPVPRARRFPGPAAVYTRFLRYFYDHQNEQIQIHRTNVFF